jgi:hypothetical protein
MISFACRHQLRLNSLRNGRARDLKDISRDCADREVFSIVELTRASDPRFLVVNHRQHEGVAKKVAYFWTLFA